MIGHHHRRTGIERGRGEAGERGAALVELALIAAFLIMLLAGSFDYGMAWRVGLVTNEAARTAARTGSALGNDPQADFYALSGAKAALANSGRLDDVQRVVVFRSTDADGAPPAQCIDGTSTSQKCNVLTGDQFRAMTESSFDATTGCYTGGLITNWCPDARDDVQLSADYYGVWIQTRYEHAFNVLTRSTLVARDAIMRIEPDVS